MTNLTAPPFAPLPVRARGTLEIFDTAFKLFRRYAGVLLGWSFLASLINLIPLGFFGYVFTAPLFYGCAACVIAAAVRGQNVTFGQVWGFTKPRYGAILGVLILAWLLIFALTSGVSLAVGILGTLVFSAVGRLGVALTVVAWIVGTLLGTVLISLVLALSIGWLTLAPLVACLEDQHRGSSSMSRALSLMSGQWRKACAVATILGLAMTAILVILGSMAGILFYGGWDKFIGADASESALLGVLAGYGGVMTLFSTISLPLLTLVTGVFYLDLRTRKEALDLEWTNYVAKPELSPDQAFAPGFVASGPASPVTVPPGTGAQVMDSSPSALDAGAISLAKGDFTPAPDAPSSAPHMAPMPVASVVPGAPSPLATAPQNVPPIFSPTPSPVTAAHIQPATATARPQDEAARGGIADSPASPLEKAPAFNPPAPPPAPFSPSATGVAVAPAVPIPSTATPTVQTPVATALPSPEVPAPQPAPVAPPAETSSFAPPRRALRADEDEVPSSFGGGAR